MYNVCIGMSAFSNIGVGITQGLLRLRYRVSSSSPWPCSVGFRGCTHVLWWPEKSPEPRNPHGEGNLHSLLALFDTFVFSSMDTLPCRGVEGIPWGGGLMMPRRVVPSLLLLLRMRIVPRHQLPPRRLLLKLLPYLRDLYLYPLHRHLLRWMIRPSPRLRL